MPVQNEPAYGCDESSGLVACAQGAHQQAPHCNAGTCEAGACLAGRADCNGMPGDGCEAWLLDPAHCGSCATQCAPGEVCRSTGCAAACGALETKLSNGACVDASQCDPGSCPVSPHGTSACVSNACTITCDSGYTLCNGKCVDTQNDPDHCGGCNACPAPPHSGAMACVAGACTPLCTTGFSLCTISPPSPPGASFKYCVDTQTDVNHCGMCGHACTTGLCVGGTCDATQARVLAMGGTYTHLALDATDVFYSDSGGATIGRVAKTGGAATVLASGESSVGGLAVDATHVYWSSTQGNAIKRVPKAGGTVEVISAATTPGPVAVDATDVFWGNNANHHLLKTAKAGGGALVDLAGPGVGGNIDDVQLDGIYVYWVSGGGLTDGLRRMPKDGSSAPVNVFTHTGVQITFDAQYVYIGDDGNGGIARCRKDLSAPCEKATDALPTAQTYLAVSGPFTYAVYGSGFTNGRGLKCGGAAPNDPLFPPVTQSYSSPIVTDDVHVFTGGSQIQRLPR